MGRNNNSNKNIKLQIKSFLKKISLQLHFKRVNVRTVSNSPAVIDQNIENCSLL